MYVDRSESRYSSRGCAIVMVLIVLGIVACSGMIYGAVEYRCTRDASLWLPEYPNSELIESDVDTLFQRFGIGSTTLVYYSPDEQIDVRNWYLENERELEDENRRRRSGVGVPSWRLLPASDPDGTFIVHTMECAPDLANF